MKRAALYVRVSTDRQTVENQIAALGKVAEAQVGRSSRRSETKALAGPRGATRGQGLMRC